ncbi:MAG: 16S rRNA (cytidine(1402)-2'-O)-methyltransferase [Thermodesulfobacteriota bacterium]
MKESSKKSETGTLYLVSTPIGNIEDITLRALRILKDVDLVAAEDTRVARKLFSTYGIKTRLESCFESNEGKKADFFLRRLSGGSDIALISDAGTPGVSDPGFRLTERCLQNSIPVRTVPGPSSVVSALSVSGFSMESFSFMGFVPRTVAKRKRFFLSLRAEAAGTCVVFETARRLKASLADACEVLGDVPVVVARELTKIHEEVMRGTISEVLEDLEGRVVLGEVALVFRLCRPVLTEAEACAMMEELLRAGLPMKEVVKALTRESGAKRTEVYKEALAMKQRLGL